MLTKTRSFRRSMLLHISHITIRITWRLPTFELLETPGLLPILCSLQLILGCHLKGSWRQRGPIHDPDHGPRYHVEIGHFKVPATHQVVGQVIAWLQLQGTNSLQAGIMGQTHLH